jgi:outer membrane protein assembly factor BamB
MIQRIGMLTVLLLTLTISQGFSQEWTRFRGPNGTGLSDATTIPSKWTEADYRWVVELPGEGHGSPVLWGKKLFVLCADKQKSQRAVMCLDADTGKTLWQRDYPVQPHHLHQFNSFAASTPALDADRVYVTWANPEHNLVTALDHDGEQLWQTDLGPFKSEHGSGVSPIVYRDLVIIPNEQDGDSSVVALDRATGKAKWSVPRRGVRTAYATPAIYSRPGAPDMLVLCSQGHGISALDPATGKTLWETPQLFDKRSLLSPVIAGDVIFGSCGSGGGARNYAVGLRLNADDPAGAPTEAFRINRAAPYVPTPIAHGGMMFLVSDGGIATCIDAATGEVNWQQRLGGDYFASPICVNGVIYAVSRGGDVITFRASGTYEQLGHMTLNQRAHATPAVAGGRLYIRTISHLYCLGE